MPHRSRSLRFARILFSLVLVLAALLPATLLAQGEDLIGVWQSDVIDAGMEGSEGLIVTISLFDDGTHETVSDFQDGEAPIFEQGDWVDNEDGTITVSFITSDGEPYGEPVDVDFEVDGDSMTAPELADYGPDGLVVFKIDDEPVSQAEDLGFEATADVVAAARDVRPGDDEIGVDDETADDEVIDEAIYDIEGVYISDELVDDTGTGAVMIYMTEDGEVQSLFNNFDGESAPVGRLGTWEETDDGLIAVTLDQEIVVEGEAAEATDLDEPEVVEFELVDGVLVNELFTLYPVDEISAMWASDDEEAVAEGEEEAAAEGATLTFVSTIDAMEAGDIIVLIATEDGSATMSVDRVEAEISVVLSGFWEESEDGILITFETDGEGADLDAPVEVLFEEDEDGNLVGVDYDTDLFGEELFLELTEE